MFQKETIPIGLEEEYTNIGEAFRALNDSFVFLVQQQTAEYEQFGVFFLHTDSHGKTLFRKEMQSIYLSKVSVDMISPKQVVVWDSGDKKIWLIDLETHEEWSTTVETKLYGGCIQYFKYFKQTKMACLGVFKRKHCQLVYYSLKDLKEKYAKPTIQWEHQFDSYHSSFVVCNNHSKILFKPINQKQTIEFQYFDLRNNPKGELQKVSANKQINIVDYWIQKIWEVEPNVYLIIYQKGRHNKIKEDPLLKCFIVDATKDEQSASIRQISLPFDNDPKCMEMQKKYPNCCDDYFIDIGEVWVFRLEYENEDLDIESVALHYVRRETLELIHTEELTHLETNLSNNYFAPHFPPFYNVEIQKKTECFKDFVLHFTTLIVPFTLREVSMCFLLHLNEDFDDDLLMDTVDLIAE